MSTELRVSSWIILGLSTLLAVNGCQDAGEGPRVALNSQAVVVDGGSEGDAGDEDAAAGDEDAGDGDLNDAQILTIIGAVNDAEIALAEYALARSGRREVRSYAHRMVSEHSEANERVASIRERRDLAPAGSAVQGQLAAQAAAARAALESTSSPAFDLAYIAAQAEAHAQVLALIDDRLLPEVDAGVVRGFLRRTRVTVDQHLSLAREILADTDE